MGAVPWAWVPPFSITHCCFPTRMGATFTVAPFSGTKKVEEFLRAPTWVHAHPLGIPRTDEGWDRARGTLSIPDSWLRRHEELHRVRMHSVMLHCRGRICALKSFSEDLEAGHVLDDDPHPISPAGVDERPYSHSVRTKELGSFWRTQPMGYIVHIVYRDYRRHFVILSVVGAV
jgi:hypothetical protein